MLKTLEMAEQERARQAEERVLDKLGQVQKDVQLQREQDRNMLQAQIRQEKEDIQRQRAADMKAQQAQQREGRDLRDLDLKAIQQQKEGQQQLRKELEEQKRQRVEDLKRFQAQEKQTWKERGPRKNDLELNFMQAQQKALAQQRAEEARLLPPERFEQARARQIGQPWHPGRECPL